MLYSRLQHHVTMRTPPHPNPLPPRGEGNKRIVLSHGGARGEMISQQDAAPTKLKVNFPPLAKGVGGFDRKGKRFYLKA